MLSANEDRISRRSASQDKVVFKNVEKRYRFPGTIMVEYILSPKVTTTSSDYVGIYQRDWKDLKQFVAVEFVGHLPSNEPNLYRCLEITCTPPNARAELNKDFQFVYVNKFQEVLGRSVFFQIVESCDTSSDNWQENESLSWLKANMNPDEIEYNKCFFRSTTEDTGLAPDDFVETADAACGDPSNDCLGSKSATSRGSDNGFSTRITPTEAKLGRGRALVKTREVVHGEECPDVLPSLTDVEFQNASLESSQLPFLNRNNMPSTKDQSVNTCLDISYPPNWYSPKNNTHLEITPFSYRGDVKYGAIPKKCSKCQAPSDYHQKEWLAGRELIQAKLQIQDLEQNLAKAKNDLELTQAALAKVKSFHEFKSRDDAIAMFNILMSVTARCGPHYANNLMLLFENLTPQGRLVPHKQPILLRPVVKTVHGRDKFLKAIIGQQEEKIRFLLAKLYDAHKIIEQANLGENVSGNVPHVENESAPKPPQSTPMEVNNKDSVSVEKALNTASCNDTYENFHLKGKHDTDGSNQENNLHCQNAEGSVKTWKDVFVVEPKFYQVDPMQASNCKVVFYDDQCNKYSDNNQDISPSEDNNNSYETKNLNPAMICGESNGAVYNAIMQGRAEH